MKILLALGIKGKGERGAPKLKAATNAFLEQAAKISDLVETSRQYYFMSACHHTHVQLICTVTKLTVTIMAALLEEARSAGFDNEVNFYSL